MKLIINGQTKEFRNEIKLYEVLEILHIEDKVMAAAINMEIVKQADWKSCTLKDGDRLELLDFVGGG